MNSLTRRLRAGTALLLAVALMPALAQDGVQSDVGRTSRFAKLVSAEDVEAAAAQEYRQILGEAAQKRTVVPAEHPQRMRLRAIAERIIPFTAGWNARAAQWKWEVNLIDEKTLNAFCMPGGKIVFYSGLLKQLQLSDDEVAIVMGHEMAHALREHARERMGKTAATRLGAGLIGSLFGFGDVGNAALDLGGQLLTLRFSREDESEADIVGLDLAARAGYDPRAGTVLWKKMIDAAQGAPPQFLSTHPSGPTRIADIEAKLPKVMPLYEAATHRG